MGAMTDLDQAEKETEAKHQADDNKNLCLRYQSKPEAKHQADGNRNDGPLYQAKDQDKAKYQVKTNIGTDFGQAGEETESKYQSHQADDKTPTGMLAKNLAEKDAKTHTRKSAKDLAEELTKNLTAKESTKTLAESIEDG